MLIAGCYDECHADRRLPSLVVSGGATALPPSLLRASQQALKPLQDYVCGKRHRGACIHNVLILSPPLVTSGVAAYVAIAWWFSHSLSSRGNRQISAHVCQARPAHATDHFSLTEKFYQAEDGAVRWPHAGARREHGRGPVTRLRAISETSIYVRRPLRVQSRRSANTCRQQSLALCRAPISPEITR
jgi:hypothetical protein